MENFDELVKRQQRQYGRLLDTQRVEWLNLQHKYNQSIPPEVATEFKQKANKQLDKMSRDHVQEREKNPYYENVMNGNRKVEIEEQSTRHEIDTIDKQKEIDDLVVKMIENQRMLEKGLGQDNGQTM